MTPHTSYGRHGEVSTSNEKAEPVLFDRSHAFTTKITCHLACPSELLPHEEAERLNDVKFLVQQLYTTLRIEEHQLSKERELIQRLEDLNSQLRPLEKVH